MKQYIAAMDIGTSGCKSILIDRDGKVESSVTYEYPLYSPRPGWNEQDPEDWWKGAYGSMREAIQSKGIDPKDIKAVSLSGQMHGLVAMDKNKKVIRRAFLWNDQRCADQCGGAIEKLGGLDELLEYTNNNLLTGYQGGKILWLREKEPGNFEAMEKALLPKDYIRYKLTGDYATDVSDASGVGFFDVKNRTWAFELLKKLDLPADLFPKVYESDEITGTVNAEAAELTGLAAGTPVAGGGGDSVIQTTGMGLIREGVLGITLGTGGIIAMGMSQFLYNKGGTLQFFCNNGKGLYHVMGVMLAAGGSYQWYRNTLCRYEKEEAERRGADAYEIMDLAAEASPPGSNRLIYLPYLSGERCPYADPNLRGAFIGLNQTHKKGDITRSVMEGVSYGVRQVSESIVKLKPVSMEKIIVSGGGSRSRLWMHILSDLFQLPAYTVSGSKEGGAYGACLTGGIAAGFWRDLSEACGIIKVETETFPNPANRGPYEEMYGIYKDMVPSLKSQFDRLSGASRL